MFRHNDLPMELAMTHRVGANGVVERCIRPNHVIEMALRVRKWTGQTETCQNCQGLPAVCVRAMTPLCSRCRDNREVRFNRNPADDMELRTRSVRADESVDGALRFEGIAVVFNSRSVDLGGFTEFIKPRAADRMEAEKPDMRYHWSHDPAITLGRVSAGTLRAKKTTSGIVIENDPPRWAAGHVESVQRRDITGQSFGFRAIEDDWHLEDGEPVREVLDMEISEFSGVAWPAYPKTSLRVAKPTERSAWLREQETAERLRLSR